MPERSTFGDLERWAAESRAREAAADRARERSLVRQAAEDADLAGILLDLAESRASVVMVTTAQRCVAGCMVAVGSDFAVVAEAGRLSLLRFCELAEVRPQIRRGAPGVRDRDVEDLGVTLADVLAQAAANRPRVTIALGSATLTGELATVGSDVVTVAVADPPGNLVYARLESISVVSFLESG